MVHLDAHKGQTVGNAGANGRSVLTDAGGEDQRVHAAHGSGHLGSLGGKRLGGSRIGIGRRMVRGPAQVLDRTGDTRERVLGTLQALPRKIERRAIARLQHQQAQGGSGVLLEDLGQRKEVAERLGHLLAVDQQHTRVHPGVRETLVPSAGSLGALVLVMREGKVGAAAVDVDRSAQVAMHHGGALGVPTGTALAPGARPAGLAGLGGLPQGKVERVVLVLVLLDARANHKVVDVAARDLTVVGIAAHGKVHVAVIGCVSVALLDKRLDHGDHGADLLGGTGTHIGIEHVGGAHDTDELVGKLACHLGGGAALLIGALDDLVVYVGEILRKGHLIALGHEPATNDVEANKGTSVADVDIVVDGGAAYIHANLALFDGCELFFFMRGAVVDTH